jgi:hypothetical protein
MDKNDRRKVVPRVCIIGGKAAPGYEIAKKIIKLCHAVAEKVNNDADIGDLLKLVSCKYYSCELFLQNILVLSICLHFSIDSTRRVGPVQCIYYICFGTPLVYLDSFLFCRFLSLTIMSLLPNW